MSHSMKINEDQNSDISCLIEPSQVNLRSKSQNHNETFSKVTKITLLKQYSFANSVSILKKPKNDSTNICYIAKNEHDFDHHSLPQMSSIQDASTLENSIHDSHCEVNSLHLLNTKAKNQEDQKNLDEKTKTAHLLIEFANSFSILNPIKESETDSSNNCCIDNNDQKSFYNSLFETNSSQYYNIDQENFKSFDYQESLNGKIKPTSCESKENSKDSFLLNSIIKSEAISTNNCLDNRVHNSTNNSLCKVNSSLLNAKVYQNGTNNVNSRQDFLLKTNSSQLCPKPEESKIQACQEIFVAPTDAFPQLIKQYSFANSFSILKNPENSSTNSLDLLSTKTCDNSNVQNFIDISPIESNILHLFDTKPENSQESFARKTKTSSLYFLNLNPNTSENIDQIKTTQLLKQSSANSVSILNGVNKFGTILLERNSSHLLNVKSEKSDKIDCHEINEAQPKTIPRLSKQYSFANPISILKPIKKSQNDCIKACHIDKNVHNSTHNSLLDTSSLSNANTDDNTIENSAYGIQLVAIETNSSHLLNVKPVPKNIVSTTTCDSSRACDNGIATSFTNTLQVFNHDALLKDRKSSLLSTSPNISPSVLTSLVKSESINAKSTQNLDAAQFNFLGTSKNTVINSFPTSVNELRPSSLIMPLKNENSQSLFNQDLNNSQAFNQKVSKKSNTSNSLFLCDKNEKSLSTFIPLTENKILCTSNIKNTDSAQTSIHTAASKSTIHCSLTSDLIMENDGAKKLIYNPNNVQMSANAASHKSDISNSLLLSSNSIHSSILSPLDKNKYVNTNGFQNITSLVENKDSQKRDSDHLNNAQCPKKLSPISILKPYIKNEISCQNLSKNANNLQTQAGDMLLEKASSDLVEMKVDASDATNTPEYKNLLQSSTSDSISESPTSSNASIFSSIDEIRAYLLDPSIENKFPQTEMTKEEANDIIDIFSILEPLIKNPIADSSIENSNLTQPIATIVSPKSNSANEIDMNNDSLLSEDHNDENVQSNSSYYRKKQPKEYINEVLGPLSNLIKDNKCLICGFVSSSKSKYNAKRHLYTHVSDRKFSCLECKKNFHTPSALRNHLQVHQDNYDFECQVCGKKFKRQCYLRTHSYSHTNLMPFSCDICNATFKKNVSLQEHLRVHTGERPFKCTICDKGFRTKRCLQTHSFNHASEKPFICKFCGKGFNAKRRLAAHLNIHEKATLYECDDCGKTFNFRANLFQHLLVHTDVRNHSCETCGMKFKLRHHLRNHILTHINND